MTKTLPANYRRRKNHRSTNRASRARSSVGRRHRRSRLHALEVDGAAGRDREFAPRLLPEHIGHDESDRLVRRRRL